MRLALLVELLRAMPLAVLLPLHPRTRRRLATARPARPARRSAERRAHRPPLGYVELTALLCNARAVLTDSGGLQKEAYFAGVPCVTLRASTEWTETVEHGWNMLVDLDAGRPRWRRWTGRRRASGRRCTATGTRGERVVAALTLHGRDEAPLTP